jgi:hypothetical protein
VELAHTFHHAVEVGELGQIGRDRVRPPPLGPELAREPLDGIAAAGDQHDVMA